MIITSKPANGSSITIRAAIETRDGDALQNPARGQDQASRNNYGMNRLRALRTGRFE